MKRTILVVDDSDVNRKILAKILSEDYLILEAENGQDALSVLRQTKANVSAVLLDIVMPVMDGYAFLDQVREDAALARIPVIVTTQKEGDDSEVQALSRGASDFLSKPYKPLIIKHRLANIIKDRETAALINAVERDTLTGIYSKEFFYHDCERRIADEPEEDFDVIFADIERFKLVNDLFGVESGDEVLRHAAQVFDTEHTIETCGRIGSDHFGVLVRRSANTKEFIDDLWQRIHAFDPRMNLVVRFGIYEVDDPTAPASVMCDRARIAAQSVKGRFGIYQARYDDSLRGKMILEQTLTTNLEESLECGQFEMYLQPKCLISTGEVVGAEALVRWNHPTEGFLPPSLFIPLFEKNGFICTLDRYIFNKACELISTWSASGQQPCPLSVNLSRDGLYASDLVEYLLASTKQHGVDPRLIHLEITETAYTEYPEQLSGVVKLLREQGFVVEMDDFGTGYSSLNMLAELPIDVVKLDLRFLRVAGPRNQIVRRKEIVVKLVIELAKALGLDVVAEGVETASHAELLKSCKCEIAQGYLYAKPMPEADFDKLWRSGKMFTPPCCDEH